MTDEKTPKYVSLAPIDDADPNRTYSKALTFALNESDIKNIALTGPYSSGKSSVIKTFEKKCGKRYKILNISLASFKDEKAKENGYDKGQSHLIEKSILQQMIYGADADNLPYSRFKKIITPKGAKTKSTIFALWIVLIYIMYVHRGVTSTLQLPMYLLYFFAGLVTFIGGVAFFHYAYLAFFKINLTRISIASAEIETCSKSEDSLFNKYLDEIIYFFKATNYNLVVFEDLDRFESTDIFVKLREINTLVNENNNDNGKITFLYAVKDDLFSTTDRTKFFDFILPVVPVVNASNSFDKIQEILRNTATKIDHQFLKDISLYCNDLRLIHNVVNEFLIYHKKINADLDKTKLLAMMFYKNLYPTDFDKLHHREGFFFKICEHKFKFAHTKETQLKKELEFLRNKLTDSNSEKIKNLSELVKVYLAPILMKATTINGNNGAIRGESNTVIRFSDLTTIKSFEINIAKNGAQLQLCSEQGRNGITIPTFADFEKEIDPNRTFLERKEALENNSSKKRAVIEKEIQKIKSEIENLNCSSLSDLTKQASIQDILNLQSDTPEDNGKRYEVLLYLVRNGHLDTDYHNFISLFHEGRLSFVDRDFLLNILNGNPPELRQKVDNPLEVINDMRESDFNTEYVLNIHLVNYLFKYNHAKRDNVVQYIIGNYEQCGNFFTTYLEQGESSEELFTSLSHKWPEFAEEAINANTEVTPTIIGSILKYVENSHIVNEMNDGGVVTDYISEYGNRLFTYELDDHQDYSVLNDLEVKFEVLKELKSNNQLIEYAYEHNLYEINEENISFLIGDYSWKSDDGNLSAKNYTTICESETTKLAQYIDNNLAEYINKVFLTLPENIKESGDVINKLLTSEKLNMEQKEKVIEKQDYIFESFEGVPSELWNTLLEKDKITPSWKDLIDYLSSEEYEESLLTSVFKSTYNCKKLGADEDHLDELRTDEGWNLFKVILNNDEIADTNYCALVKASPITLKAYPDSISNEKCLCLARTDIIILSPESFQAAKDRKSIDLVVALIQYNIAFYIENTSDYPIKGDVKERLLQSDIDESAKISICYGVTINDLEDSPNFAPLISGLILKEELDSSKFEDEILTKVIISCGGEEDQIRLLTKCIPTCNKDLVSNILDQISKIYSGMLLPRNHKSFENIPLHKNLIDALELRGFISSQKLIDEDKQIKVYTFRS
ncbi:YobI family P-loop NTPase [Maridesulfovibrio frigidus]|uniref:YobI family P-loop NTPase n=1 Tax=Maridesulfovibrio frigidus TaxID=340956 RepID=UPI0004E0E9D6|nr:hypothetical protein [Maridesulfovibrio frigidus]